MKRAFLQAEWRKLIMANYIVDPGVLADHVPHQTELDFYDGKCFVSLVGFMFVNTRLKGIKIPYHINFEEVNLRFYVKYKTSKESRKGVVFIKEIVPRPALSFVANTVYHENYETMKMKHLWQQEQDRIKVGYSWKKKNWHSIEVEASYNPVPIMDGSFEDFITNHFWGYTIYNKGISLEYEVEHIKWDLYPHISHTINVDFEETYGKEFAFLNGIKPHSVFLVEGSEIVVNKGRILTDVG